MPKRSRSEAAADRRPPPPPPPPPPPTEAAPTVVWDRLRDERSDKIKNLRGNEGIDVILTLRNRQDGEECRLAFMSTHHAADELGVNQPSLVDDYWWLTIKRPERYVGWGIIRLEHDPLGVASAALAAANDAAARVVVGQAAALRRT